MTYPLPMNAWILIPQGWPVLKEVPSVAMKFVFHHIRPLDDCHLAPSSGPFKNDLACISQKHVSVIAAVRGEFFLCYTLVGPSAAMSTRLLSAAEYVRYPQAKTWYLSWGNLFHGAWEVFNGPNPIDIR